MEGKIIFDNDTLEVTFDIPVTLISEDIRFERIQQGLTYFVKKKHNKTLSPDEAKEIWFLYDEEWITMVSVNNSMKLGGNFIKNENIFLRKVYEGRLSVYKYYYESRSPGGTRANEHLSTGNRNPIESDFIFQKEKESPIHVKEFGFRKDMSSYFSDCPELSKKIKEKDFKFPDLSDIVSFYNTICGT